MTILVFISNKRQSKQYLDACVGDENKINHYTVIMGIFRLKWCKTETV